MIIQPNRFVCYKCPLCGKLVFGTFSIFEAAKGTTKEIVCACGGSEFVVERSGKGYSFTVPCLACEEEHGMKIAFKALWGRNNIFLYCSVSDFPICCIGNFDDVTKWADEFDDTIEAYFDSELEEYFANEKVMFQMIEIINRMTHQGAISCECNCKETEVELTADKIILYCCKCGASEKLSAESDEDLAEFSARDMILLRCTKKTKCAKVIEFKKR